MDHKLNTQCTPVLWLNSNWTHIEHILEIDWAKIEHGLFDLALIEQQMYTYWPQILQLDLYWTWVEHKLNMYCTPVLRLNPNWTQIEHHFLNWTQIEHLCVCMMHICIIYVCIWCTHASYMCVCTWTVRVMVSSVSMPRLLATPAEITQMYLFVSQSYLK